MNIRILDLDGSLIAQRGLLRLHPRACDVYDWGPRVRLACSFGRFDRFEQSLADRLGGPVDNTPCVTLYGSGDFHHVSLALLRRQTQPFNLLVLDKHPDWMRGLPFLHCGTWVYHATRLPQVCQVFHVGGDVDFDNAFRRMAPWPALREGQIAVFPASRRFRRGAWQGIGHEPLRSDADTPVTAERLEELLGPHRLQLARRPLYISLDKDVMTQADAVVNWDSGHLRLPEVVNVLKCFAEAARGNVIGMDVVGDWSPVTVQGLFRRLFHWTEHPPLAIDSTDARRRNEATNLALLKDGGSWWQSRGGLSAGAEQPIARVA
jgi:hypothetical protein